MIVCVKKLFLYSDCDDIITSDSDFVPFCVHTIMYKLKQDTLIIRQISIYNIAMQRHTTQCLYCNRV